MTPPAFDLVRPDPRLAVPLLYDSPHSGRFHPADWDSPQPRLALRRGEDAYVDELVAPAVDVGATVLTALYPRSYIDANRAADDIDPDLIEGPPWPGARPSEKSRLGLGLIRRLIVPGVPVYSRRLRHEEVRARLDGVYVPYHAALKGEIARLVERFGRVWHVDWHSMKSKGNAMTPDGEGAARPDFAVGDLDGASADPAFSGFVVRTLRDLGYSVGHNVPYKGAEIVRRYGRPADGVHTLQIEVNRALYLDEGAVARTGGFEPLRDKLAESRGASPGPQVIRDLAEQAGSRITSPRGAGAKPVSASRRDRTPTVLGRSSLNCRFGVRNVRWRSRPARTRRDLRTTRPAVTSGMADRVSPGDGPDHAARTLLWCSSSAAALRPGIGRPNR
ncbi:N-formylglutamate amidohydrolase [Lichenibacterium dinghuense]|uniref:N-formylglutamate amidohydrolase n=1 Tax=Lichenibacterium dinghuense TaxID=2895977 RepID=UPI001F199A26|nr:N-formylglutamate amidohydrolase [Lichenibacterium sp. 6Y81]